jgi:hypothetical protein
MAPTFLLIVTVGLITLGLAGGPLFLSLATLGILLASGILGALVQYASATEAMAVAADLAQLKAPSATSRQAIKFAPWLNVVRFVTPTIFTLIFLFLAAILLMG